MNSKDKIVYITNWIKDYAKSINNNPTTLVIGVSGGVDSALTSTLCAQTVSYTHLTLPTSDLV